jgi:hypothetical protein
MTLRDKYYGRSKILYCRVSSGAASQKAVAEGEDEAGSAATTNELRRLLTPPPVLSAIPLMNTPTSRPDSLESSSLHVGKSLTWLMFVQQQ